MRIVLWYRRNHEEEEHFSGPVKKATSLNIAAGKLCHTQAAVAGIVYSHRRAGRRGFVPADLCWARSRAVGGLV